MCVVLRVAANAWCRIDVWRLFNTFSVTPHCRTIHILLVRQSPDTENFNCLRCDRKRAREREKAALNRAHSIRDRLFRFIHSYIRSLTQPPHLIRETDHNQANAKAGEGNRARQTTTFLHKWIQTKKILIKHIHWTLNLFRILFVVIIISKRVVEYASTESIWNDSLNLLHRSTPNIHRTGNNPAHFRW